MQEKKTHVIDIPPPAAPAANATLAQRNAYQKQIDDATDVACLMFATMDAELQKQHLEMNAYTMFEHLSMMFQSQARVEKFNTSKALFSCKQGNGPVGPHVLKMIWYCDYLAHLGFPLQREAQVDVILQSLNSDYTQFIMTFNMTEQDKTPMELLAMLRTTEGNMVKAPEKAPIMMVGKKGAKGKGKWKGKKKVASKDLGPSKPSFKKAKKPKGDVTKADKGDCHYCHKPGHWNKNCPAYLEDLKKMKGVQISGSGTAEK